MGRAKLFYIAEKQDENKLHSVGQISRDSCWNSIRFLPLLRHHQNTLDEQSLQQLWSNALEQAHDTLVLDDERHHLDEALERLAISCWWWLGLQTDFGDDQRLRRQRGESFGHGTKHYNRVRMQLRIYRVTVAY